MLGVQLNLQLCFQGLCHIWFCYMKALEAAENVS